MRAFIDNYRLSLLLTLAIVVLGARGLSILKKESIPPVDFARAAITTVYSGSSSKEVEELITDKIEEKLMSIDGFKDVVSTSQGGYSTISISIDIDKFDSDKVITETYQALQQVKGLPLEVLDPPQLTHFKAETSNPIMNLNIIGPDNNRKRDELVFQLKTQLESIKGISRIELSGYRERELQVLLNPDQMVRHHISSADIIMAIRKQSLDIPAGYLENGTTKHLVRILGKTRTVKDLENVVIRSNFSGQKILIKNVGTVIDGVKKETQKQYFYEPEENKDYKLMPSTSLQVFKSSSADTLVVIASINKSLDRFKTHLDSKYQVRSSYNEGTEIKRRLWIVINNALTGLFFVFLIFFFFLPSRIGLLATMSLPLSLLATFAVLPMLGVGFNVITMLAFVICIGMLVDNSVVIAEYYSRLISQSQMSGKQAALESVQKFWKAITATVLTTIAAFLPMLITTGVMGQFIKWIPLVLTIALLFSLFESFCLLPARLQWVQSIKKQNRYQSFSLKALEILENKFEIFIQKAVSFKYISLSGVWLLLASGVLIFIYGNKVDIFEQRNPQFYTAYLEMPPNTVLSHSDKITKNVSQKMYKIIDKKNIKKISVTTREGSSSILAYVNNKAMKSLDYKSILSQLRKIKSQDLQQLRFDVLAAGPPPGKAFQTVIQSNDRKKIKNFIDKIYPEIKNIPGIIDLEVTPKQDVGTEYKVHLNKEVLSQLGLDVSSAGLALRTALEGSLITELTDQGESFYIRVKHDDTQINSLEQLGQIKIRELTGQLISLNQIANIAKDPSEPSRTKYNFHPSLVLQANIDPLQTTSLEANQAATKIIEKYISSYPSLSYKLIGQQENLQESLSSLKNAGIIAIFAIFIILISVLQRFLFSLLVISCIPLGLIGVAWAFFLHGRSLSFFAMIGMIGLAGVVVNSAIILISYIMQLREDDSKRSLSDIVVQASKLRFKPILITNLTTLGGLFPTAYGIAGYDPRLMPMTLALFWGLLSATLLTLVWIPCGVLAIEDFTQWQKRLSRKIFSKS